MPDVAGAGNGSSSAHPHLPGTVGWMDLRAERSRGCAGDCGMRRPWMLIGLVGGSLGILTVALAPDIAVVLVGWRCCVLPTRGMLELRPSLDQIA
jgi:hypothetical protein